MFFISIIITILLILFFYSINRKKEKNNFTQCEIYNNLDAVCTGCIDNTTDCIPGYYHNDNTCLKCPIGSYCNSNTKYDCPTNKISEIGSIFSTDCKCNAGYYEVNGNCTGCPSNFYCPEDTITPIECGINRYSSVNSKSKLNCSCPTGYYINLITNECIECDIGLYCPGNSNPQLCHEGYYCSDGTMTECPSGMISFNGSDNINQCFFNCGIGKYLDNSICIDCPNDFYCPDGNTKIACPTGSHTDTTNNSKISDCICSTGQFSNPRTLVCESIGSILSTYTTKKYSLIKDIYMTVSPMALRSHPEFNDIRIMSSNIPREDTLIGSDESSFIPVSEKRGFYCRIINIFKNFRSTYKSIIIKKIILLDINEDIINSSFRLTVVSGSFITQGDYDNKFQNIDDINFMLEAGISISLLSVGDIDIKVYKIIILTGNGEGNLTSGTSGLVIDISNNTMYNNLNLTSLISDPLQDATGILTPGLPTGIEFEAKLFNNKELYYHLNNSEKLKINNSSTPTKTQFLTSTKPMTANFFKGMIANLKVNITIPIVYPTDLDVKRIVFKRDKFDSIPFNSAFIIYLQDEFFDMNQIGLIKTIEIPELTN